MNLWRIPRLCLVGLLLLGSLLAPFGSRAALAQTPEPTPAGGNPIPYLPGDANGSVQPVKPEGASSILFLPLVGDMNAAAADAEASKTKPPASPLPLLIDTDPGVDDALALIWLLRQNNQPLQVLGIVTVAGNTAVANATNNALLIRNKLGRQDIPVVMGADAPLVQPLSKTTWFIHGPDGLWFLGFQNPQDPSGVRVGAPAFYCETVAARPGVRLLALGPLTNIAQAVQQCPATMKTVGQLVILGGAKYGGNQTPVAEFNFWQDPEAAAIVLDSGMPITLVPLDAFTDPTITQKDLDKLLKKATPAVQFLAPALQQYFQVQFTNTGSASIPDVVAAAVALDPNLGVRQSALVKMVLEQSLARGESIIGLSASERVVMIAGDGELSALAERAFAYPPDPNFNFQAELGAILMRMADNAQVVISVPENLLTKTILPDLTAK